MQANLDKLGIGPGLGLNLQRVVRDNRYMQTIVRVELTLGRGPGALPLGNHGALVFRADGTLADYHGPLPSGALQAEALSVIHWAGQIGLDRHGVPLSIVREPDGQLTVEARVMRGDGMNSYAQVFTLGNPYGERREIITPFSPRTLQGYQPSGVYILTAEDLME